MGDLDTPRAQGQGKLEQVLEMVEVLAVHHGIDGERQAALADPAGELQLARLGAAVIADALRRFGLGILEAELDMVQPRLDQGGEPLAIAARRPR